MSKLGIYGGGFDPIHLAHMAVAQMVTPIMDAVWFLPCYDHAFDKRMVAPEHRLEMCRLTAQKLPKVGVCDFEIKHELHGETYETLNGMKEEYREHQFFLIIGQDNAETITSWTNYEKLIAEFPIIVIPRKTKAWYSNPPHVYLMGNSVPEISSTECRILLQKQDSVVESMLLPEVFNYIQQHKLYGA